MASLCASSAAGSALSSLKAESGARPGFSFMSAWKERCAKASPNICCASALNKKLSNRRAALGLGALRKMPHGTMITGVPSVGCTASTGVRLEQAPAALAPKREGPREDGAAVARMRLDEPALPLGVEQIAKAFRRVLRLHQAGLGPAPPPPGP